MVASLQTLAKNTLIRDILFAGLFNVSRNGQTEHLDLHTQLSNEVLKGCEEMCPDALTDAAILRLLHPHIKKLRLYNLDINSGQSEKEDSLFDLIFKKCIELEELELCFLYSIPQGVDGFFSQYISLCPENYTSISLAQCSNVKDTDVKFILERCVNLKELDVSFNIKITDQAFTDLSLSKIECQACGLKNNQRLNLSALNLSGCTTLTTTSIRRIVDLCGPSLKKLKLAQCTNIYATSLWYLCGLFQGKSDFLKNEYTSCPGKLSCSCSMWKNRSKRKKGNISESLNPDHPSKEVDKNPLTESSKTNDYDALSEQFSSFGLDPFLSSEIKSLVKDSSDQRSKISVHMSNILQHNYTQEPSTDPARPSVDTSADPTTSSTLNDNENSTSLVQEAFGEGVIVMSETEIFPNCNIEEVNISFQGDKLMSELNDHYRVCNQLLIFHLGGFEPDESQAEILVSEVEAFIQSTTPTRPNSPPLISIPRLQVLKVEMALSKEMKKVKGLFLQNQEDIRTILDSDIEDIPKASECYQKSTKQLILQSAHILILLDQYHTAWSILSSHIITSTDPSEEVSSNVDENHVLQGTSHDSENVPIFTNEYITKVRQKIIKNVQLLEQVNKEIKNNEQLKSRLRNLQEIEALQKEEIDALQEREMLLADRLSELRSHLLNEGDLHHFQDNENIVPATVRGIDAEMRDFIDHDLIDIENLEDLTAEPPDEVNFDEENNPELFTLMASEVSLLLQQAKYFHCPMCCPYAYRPQIEELNVSQTSYQNDDLAKIALKTFVTVNEGLLSLSLSWDCLDNDTMDHVAQQSPSLKRLNIDMCENLSSPTLRSFAHHDLIEISMHGVAWMQDTGIVPYLLTKGKQCALSSICLAEAYISDLSLNKLATFCELTVLNLSWCDDVTDDGLALIITTNSPTLKDLHIRQCSIEHKTLEAIALCSKLEKLDISAQIEFTEETFLPLATSLPKLLDLDLGWALGIYNKSIATLLVTCNELRKLVLDGIKTITHEPFLPIINYDSSEGSSRSAQYQPRLRWLSLQYCNEMDDPTLQHIVNKCRGSLVINDYYGEMIEYKPSK